MTEMEFLHEEEMLRSCLKIHETSARNLREQIGIIQSIKAQLLRQSRGGPKLVHHIPVPCPPKV